MYIWLIVTVIYIHTHTPTDPIILQTWLHSILEPWSMDHWIWSWILVSSRDATPQKVIPIGKLPSFPGSFLRVGEMIKLRQIPGIIFQQKTKEMIPCIFLYSKKKPFWATISDSHVEATKNPTGSTCRSPQPHGAKVSQPWTSSWRDSARHYRKFPAPLGLVMVLLVSCCNVETSQTRFMKCRF